MLDDDQLEAKVRDLLMDICEAMYRRNYELVSVGALMRLVGVNEERAATHDDEFFALDADFQKMLDARTQNRQEKNKNKKAKRQTRSGATVH